MYLLKTNEWQFFNPTRLWRFVPPFNQNLVVFQLSLVSFRGIKISPENSHSLTSQVTVDSIDTLCAGEASKPRVPVAVLSVQQRVAWASNTPKKYIICIPWASTTIKIMVDPISMKKTLRKAMVVILTPIVLMVVGIPGYIYKWDS